MAQKAVAKSAGEAGNRFVAFSFSAADVFMEVTADLVITYAEGALDWLCRSHAGPLVGKPLSVLMDPADHALLKTGLGRLGREGRLRSLQIAFGPDPAHRKRVLVGAVRLPGSPAITYLTFRAISLVSGSTSDSREDTLPDRQEFTRIAGALAEQAQDVGEDLEMLLVEIKGLSRLLGELRPDQAVALARELSALLRSLSLEGCSSGQLGGDKFALMCQPGSTEDPAGVLREALAQLSPNASLSVEAAPVSMASDMDAAASVDDLGRAIAFTLNQFIDGSGLPAADAFSRNYDKVLSETGEKITAFRGLIEGNGFDLALQPIVEISTGIVRHFEALARLKPDQAEGRWSSPFEFIRFAEDTALIQDFDMAMVRRAIDLVKTNQAQGRPVSIAVNLSGRSLENDSFLDGLLCLVRNHRKLKDLLLFEVTESASIRDLEQVNRRLAQIRLEGFKVCLDDFGAGAAGFQYLRALTVDYVKIDGIYVVEALANDTGRFFLRSMVSLCHDLGIHTIGERVETRDHANLLQSMGVRFGQGYFYAKPDVDIIGQLNKNSGLTG